MNSCFVCGVFPLFGLLPFVALLVAILAIIFAIKSKRENSNLSEKQKNVEIIYPTKLIDEIKTMKEDGVLRIYSYKISENLYAVTSSMIGEEYKDGKIFSYFDKEALPLETNIKNLSEFVSLVGDININQMLKQKIGTKARVQK